MDGIEFLMALKKRSSDMPCKIIAISGGGRMQGDLYLEIMHDMKTDFEMKKPLNLDLLTQKISELIP